MSSGEEENALLLFIRIKVKEKVKIETDHKQHS